MRLHGSVLAQVTRLVLGVLLAVSGAEAQRPQLNLTLKQPVTSVTAAAPLKLNAEAYLLQSINLERSMIGLAPVTFDRGLQAAAREHALEMARTSTLSHRLEGEADLSSRGSSAGAQFSRITENVAVGPSIVTMHGALMQSMHHRENILDNQVNAIGIAVVEANGSLWAVEDFSRSVEQLSLDEQEHRISDALRAMQLDAEPTAEARATCGLESGYVGARPAFTMRFTTGDLSQLPEQLRTRVQKLPVRSATVGACSSGGRSSDFASYNIAIELYR